MNLNRSLLLALTLSATLFACGDKEPDGDDDTGSTSDDTGGDDTGPVIEETIEAVSATLLVDDGDTETLVSTTQLDNVGSVDVTYTLSEEVLADPARPPGTRSPPRSTAAPRPPTATPSSPSAARPTRATAWTATSPST